MARTRALDHDAAARAILAHFDAWAGETLNLSDVAVAIKWPREQAEALVAHLYWLERTGKIERHGKGWTRAS